MSAEIVTFRLVGGMHPPHPPPKSATAEASIKPNILLMLSPNPTGKARPNLKLWSVVYFQCIKNFIHILKVIFSVVKK